MKLRSVLVFYFSCALSFSGCAAHRVASSQKPAAVHYVFHSSCVGDVICPDLTRKHCVFKPQCDPILVVAPRDAGDKAQEKNNGPSPQK